MLLLSVMLFMIKRIIDIEMRRNFRKPYKKLITSFQRKIQFYDILNTAKNTISLYSYLGMFLKH